MTKREQVRQAGAAFSLVLHLLLLALLLSSRPFPGIAPPEPEPPLSVALDPEPPPPVPVEVKRVEPRDHAAQPGGSSSSDIRIEPPPDLSRPILPTEAPSFLPSDPGLQRSGEDQTGPGSGSGAGSGSGTGSGTGGGAGPGSGGRADDGGVETLVRPSWIVKPTEMQMRDANPIRAQYGRVSGGAVISCFVTPRNRARNCHILSESPPGYGFGAAVIQLSVHFRIRPPERGGRPRYDVRVRIPVYFDNPE